MRLVSQESFNDATIIEECEEYQRGRKNFLHSRRRVAGFCPAWATEGSAFRLTLHPHMHQEALVIGYACGRIMRLHSIDAAIVESIAVLPAHRGGAVGVRMQEYIIKVTGLPLAAAHTQTPQGRDLWLRMLKHAKQMVLHIIDNGTYHRIRSAADIAALPFDPFDGRDATFLLDKNDIAKVAAKVSADSAPTC